MGDSLKWAKSKRRILRKLKICFPRYFGITRRNIKNIFSFIYVFYKKKDWMYILVARVSGLMVDCGRLLMKIPALQHSAHIYVVTKNESLQIIYFSFECSLNYIYALTNQSVQNCEIQTQKVLFICRNFTFT